MNFAAYLTTLDSSCFFELTTDGQVVYSRFRQNSRVVEGDFGFVGHNFFDEIAGFKNAEEFRRKFVDFIESHEFADNFIFECRYAEKTVSVRVMMLRAFESKDFSIERGVMLDIRNNLH